jgi:carbonic anhydrase
VMGHGMCGGCQAALTQSMHGAERGEGGFVADWISLLDHERNAIVSQHGTTGREAERAMEQAGVRVSLANLRTFPCVATKEARGQLKLRGALFSITDGVLRLLDEDSGAFVPVG